MRAARGEEDRGSSEAESESSHATTLKFRPSLPDAERRNVVVAALVFSHSLSGSNTGNVEAEFTEGTDRRMTVVGKSDTNPGVIGGNKMKRIASIFNWLMNPPTDGPKSTILCRLMAGGVFLWEGILKFVYTNQGIGRFTKLGIPFPHFSANFVACLEIGGGILLLTGLLTRMIAIPFIAEMMVAMLSTKISLYLGTSPLPLPSTPPTSGIWAVLHEVRSEYAQLIADLFLMINGPGKWSLDALFSKRREELLAQTVVAPARKESAKASATV